MSASTRRNLNARGEPRKRAPKGSGGISQRANGLWIGTITLPPDPATGKRRTRTVSSMDRRLLEGKMKAERQKLEHHGDIVSGTGDSLAKYLRYWFRSVNKSRPATRAGYRTAIEQYIIPKLGRIKLDRLTPGDVRSLEGFIVDTKGLSPTTALGAHNVLAKALKDAEREGRITRNVARMIDPPRKAVQKVTLLSVDEGIEVLRSVEDDRLGSRWATALLTGARRGECLGIELDRIDLRRDELDLSWQLQRVAWAHGCGEATRDRSGVVSAWPCGRPRGTDCPRRYIDAPADWEHRHVTGGLYLARPKSKAGRRVIPLVEPLRSILERRIAVAEQEPNPYGLLWTADPKLSPGPRSTALKALDGMPVEPAHDSREWHRVLDRAGVPQMKLHDARHTAVTILYDLGVPETVIQDIVGQSIIATTRGYRARSRKPIIEALTALGETLGPRLELTA